MALLMQPLTAFGTVIPSQADVSAPTQRHGFYPYTDNGGSTLGIAGSDFTILAGDTRNTSGYSINTRMYPKLFRIGGTGSAKTNARIVLAVVGFSADGQALKERLDAAVDTYRHAHNKEMSVSACAQKLSHLLYGKRFFPYYVHATLGGLDENGAGFLYSFDPVGSGERVACRAEGAASRLMMPFLDNQVDLKNQYQPAVEGQSGLDRQPKSAVPLDQETALQLVQDAFSSSVERHIEVGDGLQMMIISKDGIEERFSDLKKD